MDLLWRHHHYGNVFTETGGLNIWYDREMANNDIRDFPRC